DLLERKMRVRDFKKTIDIAFGLKENTIKRKKTKTKKYLLCELRLNYKNPKNISKSEISEKFQHSREILFDIDINFHEKYILIFKKNIVAQAKNNIARVFMGNTSKFEILSPQNLWSNYFE
ncbi:MAG: hypothetical protein Q4G63_12775, partial [Bacteroidia bacterium]|nr:hypothetical protein [Bacteroidia bacterium]